MPLRLSPATPGWLRPLIRRAPTLALASLLAVLACSHSEPFPPGEVEDAGPFNPGLPLRLTRNGGADRFPSWLRDGSGFLYSYQDTLYRDRDRCLGRMGRDGGTRVSGKCIPGDHRHDTTNAILTSAVSSSGRAAWFQGEGPRSLAAPLTASLRVGSIGPNAAGTVVWEFPYFAPDNQLHTMAMSPTWLGDSILAYVGAEVFNIVDCAGCVMDTVPVGRHVVLLRLNGPTPALELVPGTQTATSVSAAPDGSALYYTLGGDTQVYRRTLATGAVTPVHDFGEIVRDVSVAESTLVAIVGGQVSYVSDPQYGPVQRDQGGPLVHLNMNSGQVTMLSSPIALHRHPALSPDGRRIVVETHAGTGGVSPDLWLYGAP